jgi:arabinogalactan oligomer/maltooligosaccharide transport system permease protein
MTVGAPSAQKKKPEGGTFDIPSGGQSWWQRYRLPYLYILPAFIVLAIVTFYPIGYELWLSLTDFNIRSFRRGYNFVGLDNYVRILRGDLPIPNFDFWRVVLFNFTWTFVNVFFHVVIGIAVAILLNRPRVIGRRLFRAVYVIPWAMPPLVVSLIWNKMFNSQFGAINLSLKALGLPHDIRWLESTDAPIPFLPFLPLAFYAVAIANIWLGWPFMMVVATRPISTRRHASMAPRGCISCGISRCR